MGRRRGWCKASTARPVGTLWQSRLRASRARSASCARAFYPFFASLHRAISCRLAAICLGLLACWRARSPEKCRCAPTARELERLCVRHPAVRRAALDAAPTENVFPYAADPLEAERLRLAACAAATVAASGR